MLNTAFAKQLSKITRLDANETVFFSRQLETIDPVNYLTLFAGLLGRRFLPRVENVNPLDNTYTYRMWTIVGGDPKFGAPGSNDDPTVRVTAEEKSTNIKQIPVTYGWSLREIQQAAKSGTPLDQLTVMAAMSHVERTIDKMIALGDSGTGATGLLNHALVVNTLSPVAKTGGGTAWSDAAKPAELIADVNNLVNAVRKALIQATKLPGGDTTPAFDRFVILLPQKHYGRIASTPRSDNSDTTILKYILANNPWIESIEEWWQCDTADGGTDPRMVCYPRNPMFGGALIPDDWHSLPPQEEGHDVVIPAGGSCGGSVLRYTVAAQYMDDI